MTARRMSRADRRALLLDAARDVVAVEGVSSVTIERVARAAQVTRTVVYQHFTDLAGLMTALLDREAAFAFAGVGSVDMEGASLDDVGRGILAYLHAAPASWQIILRPVPPELRERMEIGRAYARQVAARHLSTAVGTPVDPDGATVRILLASVEELARLHLEGPGSHADDDVLRYLNSLVRWAIRLEHSRSDADRP